MAKSEFLQIRGYINVLSGGYPGEPKGMAPAYANWANCDENTSQDNGALSYYYYCDSNIDGNQGSYMMNLYRTQTNVSIKTWWESSMDDENIIHITTHTALVGVDRIFAPGADGDAPASRGGTGPAGRDIWVYHPNTPCRANGAGSLWSTFIPWNANGNVFSGNIHVSDVTFSLVPGETSQGKSGIIYWNAQQGYGHYICMQATYTDGISLGFQFRNNMPTVLPAPVWMDTDQHPDICENYVDIDLIFEPFNVGGAEIYVEWRYDGQDWSSDRSFASGRIQKGKDVIAALKKIAPTNHTNKPRILYWRAQARPVTVKMQPSEWVYGQIEVMYVPAPNMTVPDITSEECSAIGKGDYIEPWTSEQCYTETSCADQEQIRDVLKEQDWEKNRHCRFVNGVATADDIAKGDK